MLYARGDCKSHRVIYNTKSARVACRSTNYRNPEEPTMPSEPPLPANPDPATGLPPVAPPSARMIMQLFIVPMIIIAVVLVVVGGVRYLLVGGHHDPAEYLKKLDDPNLDVRWRAAEDLASELAGDDRLASDPGFALDLADRLQRSLQANAAADRDYARKLSAATSHQTPPPPKDLDAERKFILYLTSCLGNMMVPAGEPVLAELAVQTDGADAQTIALRRRQALWALAKLGGNIERFDRLPTERQDEILTGLDEAANARDERGRWAKAALDCLRGRKAGKPEAMGIDAVMATCAADRFPFMRQAVAVALSYWEGTPEENARMEQTLLGLLHSEDGRGTTEEIQLLNSTDPDSYPATDDPKMQALGIRYQAAMALARRGSGKAPLPVLAEMLDEDQEKEAFHHRLKNGQTVPDPEVGYQTLVNTLKAVAELHRKNPPLNLGELRPAIEKLKQSGNAAVRAEAEATLLVLDG
jgi:hypothetical protein